MQDVSPILAADKGLMLQHLTLLFGRALGGRIEISGIHTDDDVRPKIRTRFFGLEDLEAAADHAAELNAEPGRNVYVGAALRNEDVFPGHAADDTDFMCAYAVWADADDAQQLSAARAAYRLAETIPPFIVVTGRTPSTRAQLWWPLESPIHDIDVLRASLRGIASALKTDPKVCTGKQLMRLAGGVNWPKKEDRVLERTEIVRIEGAQKEFPLEQVHRAFPPLSRIEASATSIPDIEVAPAGALGLDEKIMDGREGYAFRLIRATLRQFIGENGAEPTPDELFATVAPHYFKRTDQMRPGRGPHFLKTKCIEAINAFHAGQIPGMASLEEAVIGWAERNPQEAPEPEEMEDDDDRPFAASDLRGDPPERRWVVTDWIVEGAVNSLYGDGGLGKTLLAQQLACSVSLGAPWLGIETTQGTVLAVLCEDDKDELWRRHNDIKAALGHTIGNPFENVWLWPRVGRENTLVHWDRDGKACLSPFAARLLDAVAEHAPSLLILDTLADFYGGNEIDRVQVNYFVKTVLGGIIRTRQLQGDPLTVLLLGHPSVGGKADGRGFSGSTAWNAAVRSRLYLTRPEDGPSDERVLTRGKANYAKSGDETAVRLFYADGVLRAAEDTDDSNSLLWACRRDVVAEVDRAWKLGEPYSAQKGHRREIYGHLPRALERSGYGPQIVRQAVRECVEDGRISVSSSNGKRGYREAGNGR